MQVILILAITVTLLSSCVLSWYIAVNKVRLDRDKYELDRYDLNINSDIKLDQLDEFIQTIINEYLATHVSPSEFINTASTKLIMRECVNLIETRMTQALRDQFSLFYNDDKLDEIIVNKAFIYISAFVREKNANTVIT